MFGSTVVDSAVGGVLIGSSVGSAVGGVKIGSSGAGGGCVKGGVGAAVGGWKITKTLKIKTSTVSLILTVFLDTVVESTVGGFKEIALRLDLEFQVK